MPRSVKPGNCAYLVLWIPLGQADHDMRCNETTSSRDPAASATSKNEGPESVGQGGSSCSAAAFFAWPLPRALLMAGTCVGE